MVETIEDVIVRRLTTERIEELKKLLRDTQDQYRYTHTYTQRRLQVCFAQRNISAFLHPDLVEN